MHIYAHRGLWQGVHSLQNTAIAIESAFELGFGVEIDLWKILDKIFITHDGDSREFEFAEFLKIWSKYSNLPVALNVKTDGIADQLSRKGYTFEKHSFFFDMSFPELVKFKKENLPIALRISELEPVNTGINAQEIYWLDSFYSEWWIQEFATVESIYDKSVIVSPELHNRDYLAVWNFLKVQKPLGICTDFPNELLDFLS
jgi:glycerophosphoryl diester phosphodiesterase